MLKKEVDDAKHTVNTDTLAISIGEISSMYQGDELNIMPDFQRLFRWSNQKKSHFIESILIGIPVPPVFVYEDENGSWELIDGLQRVSTILEFMGVLRDPDFPDKTQHSVLSATRYLSGLHNVVWDHTFVQNENEAAIDKSLQLFIRRARIDFQVLKYPSSSRAKYDLFNRLNRGGSYANEQEVRSCSMVLANPDFTRAIKDFCKEEEFKSLMRISEDDQKTQTDVEHVVRLAVHTFRDYDGERELGEFLNDEIISVITSEDQNHVMDTLRWTIHVLHETFGEDALIPPKEFKGAQGRKFSLRALESIAVGVARNSRKIRKKKDPCKFVRDKIEEFWKQPQAGKLSVPGQSSTRRIQKTIPFGEEWFSE
jgi:hypothetical protein